MQVNDITETEELDSFNIQNCAPFGGKFNMLVKVKSDMTRGVPLKYLSYGSESYSDCPALKFGLRKKSICFVAFLYLQIILSSTYFILKC